jgi:hypothetical protein
MPIVPVQVPLVTSDKRDSERAVASSLDRVRLSRASGVL